MRGFIPFLLVLFAIAALFQASVFFTVLYLLIAVYILARIWLQRSVLSLQAKRSFEKRMFIGRKVTVELEVRNTGRLPVPWVEIDESLPVQLATPPIARRVTSLRGSEHCRLRYTLAGRTRGYYLVGPLRMRAGGLLGIHPSQVVEIEPEYLIVYPRILSLEQLGIPTRSPQVVLPARCPLFEDPSCVIGVRDYQRGDSPRRIHWTATANTGRLLVKQYRPSIARETLICLDMDKAGYEQEYRFTAPELAVVVAASIANHIVVREGLAVGLATEAMDPLSGENVRFVFPPRPRRDHLMNLLEVLARVQVTPASPLAGWLRRESVNLSWGATLVIVTGRENEALLDSLACLRRAGFAITLILVQPGRPSPELERRAELMGVPIHRVWREQDLRKGVGDDRSGAWL